MITTFSANAAEFAAQRKPILESAFQELRPHVRDAVNRVGLPSWERQVVDAALDIFDVTARAEVDEWSPGLDEMRDAFALELAEALAKTHPVPKDALESQTDTLTRWVAQMSHNAAMEAATTTDPNEKVGLEWVTMGDGDVRSTHRDVAGQQVPAGQEFEVQGEKLLYPGQPVGDPSIWINCRCVARPTMLGEMSVSRETFGEKDISDQISPEYKAALLEKYAGSNVDHSVVSRETFAAAAKQGNASDPGVAEGEDPKAAVVVLRPRVEDPVTAMASGIHPHCTLLYLGDATVDLEPLKGIVESVAAEFNPLMTDRVSGRAVLGDDEADVLLLDAAGSGLIRSRLMEEDGVLELLGMQEQYPAWIPHLTVGYPEAAAEHVDAPDQITYDLLSIWRGNEQYDYPLGEAVPEKKPEPQEAPNAVTAAIETSAPVKDAEPDEAAPAADAPAAPAGEGSDLRPWHGVIAPEAAPSGDKRQFAERALSTRNLPLPLKAMFVDDEGHKGSVVVGRIDNVFRKNGKILADGVFDNTPEADRAYGMIERKMWRGVSVDLDAVEVDMDKMSDAEVLEFMAGRIASATLCAIPAFAEAFVGIGGWENYDEMAAPTGAMNEIQDWPEATALVAAGAKFAKPSVDYFKNPLLKEPTALTVTEDGHVYGHLAQWGVCHIGFDTCTTAPPSHTDYAWYASGTVLTDAGPVAVGQISLGGGHAPDGLSVRATIAHYDSTSTAVADVSVGEDEFGIWFSGKVRPWISDEKIYELRASSVSGDWRGVMVNGREELELVAALAVNVPGFHVPRTSFAMDGDRQVSLVAAGVVPPRTADEIAGLSPEFKSQMDLYFEAKDREKRMASLMSEVLTMQYSDVFTEITRLEGK